MQRPLHALSTLVLIAILAACGAVAAPTITPSAAPPTAPPTAVASAAPSTLSATTVPTAPSSAPTRPAGATATRVAGSPSTGTATRAATTSTTPTTGGLTFTDSTRTTVTLTKPPERIACLTGICLDILAELGLEPVAYFDALATDPRFFGERARGYTRITGAFNAPNLEDIARARPDLVIGFAGAQAGLREALGPIAPLYIMGFDSYEDSLRHLRDIGRLTGRSPQAEAAARRFTDRLATYEARAPKNKSALLMWGTPAGSTFGIDTAKSQYGALLARLARYPWQPGADGQTRPTYSLEGILVGDPEVIFVASNNSRPAGTPPLSEILASNPLWGELRAVKQRQVYEVDFQIWLAGRGTRSLGIVLDEAATKLYPEIFPQPLP